MSKELVQRVRMYLNVEDQADDGQPRYRHILQRLQNEGATGATALHGLLGFGPRQRLRGERVELAERTPLVIEWIDRAERVQRTLPLLADLLPNALVTIEDVQVYQALMRAQGPFTGERNVSDVMQPVTTTHAAAPSDTLAAALAQMHSASLQTLPVVNAQGRLLGVLNEQPCLQRAGVHMPLPLLLALDSSERAEILGEAAHQPLSALMDQEPRSVYQGASLPQALTMMIEWNYEQIPVLGRDSTLVGLLSNDDILQAAVAQEADSQNVHTVDMPTPVRLVMQSLVPHIEATRPLAEALKVLLATPGRFVIVQDVVGRVQGYVREQDALNFFTGEERTLLLAALASDNPAAAPLPGAQRSISEILVRDVPCFAPTDSVLDAARRLHAQALDYAPVLDDEGKLVGVLGRNGVLRALLQENA